MNLFTLILLIIFIYIILYSTLNTTSVESFTTSENNVIKDLINQVYKADIEAIRNLSNYATYLMTGVPNTTAAPGITGTPGTNTTIPGPLGTSITVPGTIKSTSKICIGNTFLDETDLKKILDYTKNGFVTIGANNNTNTNQWKIDSNGDWLSFFRTDAKTTDAATPVTKNTPFDKTIAPNVPIIAPNNPYIAMDKTGNMWLNKQIGNFPNYAANESLILKDLKVNNKILMGDTPYSIGFDTESIRFDNADQNKNLGRILLKNGGDVGLHVQNQWNGWQFFKS
jgi:hypothetical protein